MKQIVYKGSLYLRHNSNMYDNIALTSLNIRHSYIYYCTVSSVVFELLLKKKPINCVMTDESPMYSVTVTLRYINVLPTIIYLKLLNTFHGKMHSKIDVSYVSN